MPNQNKYFPLDDFSSEDGTFSAVFFQETEGEVFATCYLWEIPEAGLIKDAQGNTVYLIVKAFNRYLEQETPINIIKSSDQKHKIFHQDFSKSHDFPHIHIQFLNKKFEEAIKIFFSAANKFNLYATKESYCINTLNDLKKMIPSSEIKLSHIPQLKELKNYLRHFNIISDLPLQNTLLQINSPKKKESKWKNRDLLSKEWSNDNNNQITYKPFLQLTMTPNGNKPSPFQKLSNQDISQMEMLNNLRTFSALLMIFLLLFLISKMLSPIKNSFKFFQLENFKKQKSPELSEIKIEVEQNGFN